MGEDDWRGREPEFLDDVTLSGAVDEELPQPTEHRAARRGAVVVAVLALVAAVAAVVAHHGGDGHPVAAPSPTVSSSAPTPSTSTSPARPTPRTRTRIVQPLGLPSPFPKHARQCPQATDGQNVCESLDGLTLPVDNAVDRWFPGTVRVSAFQERVRDTGTGPGPLWFRVVHWSTEGRRYTARVSINQVRRHRPSVSVVTRSRDGVTVLRSTRRFTVEVSVTGPQLRRDVVAAMQGIAADTTLQDV